MARRQPRSPLTGLASRSTAAKRDAPEALEADAASPPSSTVRSVLTVWLIAHGFLLLVAYSSAIEPSAVQQRLLGFFGWYVNGLHLGLDGRPVYVAHGGWAEAAHQFQTRLISADSTPADPASAGDQPHWQPVSTPGWVGGERRKRYQRWARSTAILAQQQQAGLAGLLARRAANRPEVKAVRVVQIPNPSIPPMLEPNEPPYQAAVVREGDQLRFVHLTPARQNAIPTAAAGPADASAPTPQADSATPQADSATPPAEGEGGPQ